uniref:inositol 1,4,5-triphosphate receptor associated 1-like isoform X3 n=1 Tax=Myxine glutinosa TaxID=7769 RepID=UPI00358E6360
MDRSSFAAKHHPGMDLWVNVAPMPYSVRQFIGVNSQEVDENLKISPACFIEGQKDQCLLGSQNPETLSNDLLLPTMSFSPPSLPGSQPMPSLAEDTNTCIFQHPKNQQSDTIYLSTSAPSMSSDPSPLCNSTPISYDAARNRPGRLFRLSPVSTTSLASIDTSLEGTKHFANAQFATTARQVSGLVSAAHLLESEGSKSDESIDDKQKKTGRYLSGIDFDPNHGHCSDDRDLGSAAEGTSISHAGQQVSPEVGECGQHLSLVQLNKGEGPPLSSMELQAREDILDWKLESGSQEKYEMTNKAADDGLERQQRPRGAAANVSDSLLQSLKLQPRSPSLNEQEVETAFTRLSLAFQNDKFTLDKRLRLEARARDLVEEDVDQEIENMKWTLQQLELQCQEQVQQELLQQLQQTLQVIRRCYTRLSSQAEMLGAVNQEGRLACAAEVMLLYVEQLRRTCAREQAELSELRRLLHDNTRSSASTTDNLDDPLGRNKRCMSMSASLGKVMARRRMSVAVIPKFCLTSPITPEQPTRSPNFLSGMETKQEAEQKESIKKEREEKKRLSIETMEKHGLRIEQPLEEGDKEELDEQKEQNINLADNQEKFASLLQAEVEERWPASFLKPNLFHVLAISILLIGTALCILCLFLLRLCSGAEVRHPA